MVPKNLWAALSMAVQRYLPSDLEAIKILHFILVALDYISQNSSAQVDSIREMFALETIQVSTPKKDLAVLGSLFMLLVLFTSPHCWLTYLPVPAPSLRSSHPQQPLEISAATLAFQAIV